MKSYILGLKCLKCGHEQSDMDRRLRCGLCGGYMQAAYDLDAVGGTLSPAALTSRRGGMWRYRELLPVRSEDKIVSLGEGGTPLLRSRNIGPRLGLRNLYFKDLSRNPTGSFKDYSSSTSISKALEIGFENIVLVSAGNASASFAAYCTVAGIGFHALTLPGSYPAMVVQNAIFGAHSEAIAAVEARPKVKRLTEEQGFMDGAVPTNPYRVEGKKVIGYEIAESLDWHAPSRIVCPTAGGTSIMALFKGFSELQALGWIDAAPALDCIQTESCSPVVDAWRKGGPVVGATNPNSIAIGLLSANPEAGPYLVDIMRETGGAGSTVSDDEIRSAQISLAREEGLFVEPSSAAALAGMTKLRAEGRIGDDDSVVLMLTGSGLKAPEIIAPYLS